MFYFYLAIVIAASFGIGYFIAKGNSDSTSLTRKENLQKLPTEKGEYFVGTVEGETNVMFTPKEIERAAKRATKNPEDFS